MTTVLLTGATGFVGGATAATLLRDDRVERLLVLVRATRPEHAVIRLRESLARFEIEPCSLARVEVLCGDLERCLVPKEALQRVTHVLHAAAHTSFRSRRTVWSTNVEGTRALANAVAGAPKLERFLFVGSAYRCGALSASVVGEDVPAAETHVAEYTRTKAEAELLLERTSLPLLIARPSIVVGHTRLGVAPSASLYWYYRALARAGLSPFPDTWRRDIVPVDWVADALTALLLARSPRFGRYHLSAGERSADTWGAIRNVFVQLGEGSRRVERIAFERLASHPAWAALELDSRTRVAIDACARFSALPIEVFSNARLLEEGVTAPPRFTSYLPRCVESSLKPLREQAFDDA